MDEQERRIAHVEALLELGRGAEAERSVRQALAAEPESAHVAHLLARSIWLQDRPTDAVSHARVAVQIDPEDADHLLLLAALLLESDGAEEARQVALSAVGLDPDNWLTHWLFAAVLLQAGDEESRRIAEQAAHRAVSLRPDEADTHNIYGLSRWRANDEATAETAFTNALAVDPQHAGALANLGQLRLGNGDLAEGSLALSRALSLSPQDRELHSTVGTAVAAVLFHTAMLAALTTLLLRTLQFWVPASWMPGLVIGGTFAVAGPFVSALRNLPPRSWRLMIPRRTRQELPLLATSWLVLGVCLVAIVAPVHQVAVAAVSVLGALLVAMVVHYLLSGDRAGSQERPAK